MFRNLFSETHNKAMLVLLVLVFYVPTVIIANSFDNSQSQSIATRVLCWTVETTEYERR